MSYEVALILGPAVASLVFAIFTISFDEGKGAYKHFFSLFAIYSVSATLQAAYNISKVAGEDTIADYVLAPFKFGIDMLLYGWLFLFLLGIAVSILNYVFGQKKQDPMGISKGLF